MNLIKSLVLVVGFSLCVTPWARENDGSIEQRRTTESAFKTFKKDLKCFFSKQGCTSEQKKRLFEQAIALIAIILAIGGGYYYGRLKFDVEAFKADYDTQIADLHNELEGLKGKIITFPGMDQPVDAKKAVEEVQLILDQLGPLYAEKKYYEASKVIQKAQKKLAEAQRKLAEFKG